MTPPEEPPPHVLYEFGAFRLDCTRRLLFVQGSSEPLPLTPKALDALVYFVDHRDELLSKDQLLAQLWPGVVVEENSLAHLISQLRRVLGETRGENRYLMTIQGRGYRFVADVTRTRHDPVAQDRPAEPGAVPSGKARPWPTLAAVLTGVTLVVCGAYGWHAGWWRRAGATAAETGSAAVVAPHTAPDLPQRNSAAAPVAGLESGDESLSARFGADAYRALLQGRTLLSTRTRAATDQAVVRLSQAVALAPGFAAAYVALAQAHLQSAAQKADQADPAELEEADTLLARALRLDARRGDTFVARGLLKFMKGDDVGSDADLRRGLALSPNYAAGHEQYGEQLYSQGRLEQGRAELDEAIRLDPLAPRGYYYKALTYVFQTDPRQPSSRLPDPRAEALFLQTLQVAPDFHPALLWLGIMRSQQGRLAEAVRLAERAVAIDPRAQWMRRPLVEFYLELRDVDAARSVLTEQPDPLQQSLWSTVCLYQRQAPRAIQLLRADASRPPRVPLDGELGALVIRDAALAAGDLAGARRELLRQNFGLPHPPEQDPARMATLAQVNLALGDRDEARRRARQVLEQTEANRDSGPYQRAVALVVLGQENEALATLEQSFALGSAEYWWYILEREPAFNSLHTNARFRALALRVNSHVENERRQLQQLRERGEVPHRAVKALPGAGTC